MSPREPVPKSHQPLHLKGRYALLYSRYGAGPNHKFQSKVFGTVSFCTGVGTPCGQTGRFVQTCTFSTFPMTPD